MKKPLFLFAGTVILLTMASASGCTDNDSAPTKQEVNALSELAESTNEAPNENNTSMESNLNAKVRIITPMGTMIAELYDQTPKHRDNFLKLAREGYYNDLIFHRVIDGFMVQGGDPDSRNAPQNMRLGSGGPDYKIEAEFVDTLVHVKGALAAARQGDMQNPRKMSSGSQFYIVQGQPTPPQMLLSFEKQRNARRDSANFFKYSDEQIEQFTTQGGTPHLDGEYTVFGQVIEGLEVIDSIAAVKTGAMNRPVENIWFKVEVVEP